MSETSMKRHMGLSASRKLGNTLIYIVLIAISAIWLIPFFCIVLQSFRVESTWQVGYVMPKVWGLDNYRKLFSSDFTRWYTNTFIISVFTALFQTVIVLCMSYTLSRFRFKMRKPLMRFMLVLGFFPGMLTMIILYRVLKDLGLTQANAVPGLILVYVASSGMGYYVSKGFFDTIPKSLDEAARVDGATRFQVLRKIILLRLCPLHFLRRIRRYERGGRSVQLADAGPDQQQLHHVLRRRRTGSHSRNTSVPVLTEVLCGRCHRRCC